MISVRWVSRPVGIRVVRCNDLQSTTGLGDAMKLRHKAHHIRNMLDDVTANDLFKFVVAERIGKASQIMYDVGMTPRIGIDPDRASIFVLTTADIENLLLC